MRGTGRALGCPTEQRTRHTGKEREVTKRVSYSTVDLALREVTDSMAFERSSYYVLRERYPTLRITAPTADGGKDLRVAPLGSERDDVRVMVSIEGAWNRKLDAELRKIERLGASERPADALFVTNQNATETAIALRKKRALELGVRLEVMGHAQLVTALDEPRLRWVAEFELDVEPLTPRPLLASSAFSRATSKTTPGFDAKFIGQDDTIESLCRLLWSETGSEARMVVLEGPGGIGKTRLAVDVSSRLFTTSVLPMGIPLRPEQVHDVPAGVASIIVVDDVHRAEDLSGIRALLMDERFDDTRIVMTSRPGRTAAALAAAGLSEYRSVTISMDALPREDIARIVAGWGINDARFATTVVEVSRGVPLVAHAMCEAAIAEGRFEGRDMVDVLNSRLAARLDAHDPGARAVAVALAMASTSTIGVGDSEVSAGVGAAGLAQYARAVSQMPEPAVIAETLELLADVGLAQVTVTSPRPGDRDFTYSVKPDLLAASLVGTALGSERGVQVGVSALLEIIGFPGEAGSLSLSAPSDTTRGLTAYGGETVLGRLDSTLATHQLSILAQAAAIAGDDEVLDRLSREVVRLIPQDPSARDWGVVFNLAGTVAPYVPGILSALLQQFDRHWPPRRSENPTFWFESPSSVDDYELEQLASSIAALVRSHGAGDASAATRLALIAGLRLGRAGDAASVARRNNRDTLVSRAVKGVVTPRANEPWTNSLERRLAVVGAVQRWVALPGGSGAGTGARTGVGSHADPDREILHVALTALLEAIDPICEAHTMGSPEAADVLVTSTAQLPATPATTDMLDRVGSAIAELVTMLDFDGASRHKPEEVIRSFVDLPHEWWAVGRRGLPSSGGAIHPKLVKGLLAQARRVEQAFADRWPDLPLWVRYELAKSVEDVRPSRGLEQRARSGSPVAAAAVVDTQLLDLIALAPLRRPTSKQIERAVAGRVDSRAKKTAKSVADRIDLASALGLLQTAAVVRRNWLPYDPVGDFVDATAARVDDGAELAACLEAVLDGPVLASAGRLVSGLLERHPTAVAAFLRERSRSVAHVAVLSEIIGSVGDGALRRELTETTLELVLTLESNRRSVDESALLGHVSSAGVEDLGPATYEERGVKTDPEASDGTRGAAGFVPTLLSPVRWMVGEAVSAAGAAANAVGAALGVVRGPGGAAPDSEPSSPGSGLSTEDEAAANGSAMPRSGEAAPARVELDSLARAWVQMTWRLPDDADPADGQPKAPTGWRVDALIRMGLEGPAAVLGEVLLRSTYDARRTRRATKRSGRAAPDQSSSSTPQEGLTEAQLGGLLAVLGRALTYSDGQGWRDLVADWDFGAAVSEIARLAPEQTAELLASWCLGPDGSARRLPLDWDDPIGDLDGADRSAFGLALSARLDERLAAIEYADESSREFARFEADQVLRKILHDSSEWIGVVSTWIDSPETTPRAVGVLARMWRSPAWAPLVLQLIATVPSDELLDAVIEGMVPTGFGPEIEKETEPRFSALSLLTSAAKKGTDVDDAKVEAFAANARSALQAVIDEYRGDAERRRNGY
jgi:hypothetical protein